MLLDRFFVGDGFIWDFTDAYKKMLEEHFDDYAENYDQYMGRKS